MGIRYDPNTNLPILAIPLDSPEAEKYSDFELQIINYLQHPTIVELVKSGELDAREIEKLMDLYTTQNNNEALEALKSGVASYITPQNWGEAVLLGFDAGTLAIGGGILALKGAQAIGKLSKFVPRPEYLKYFRGSPQLRAILSGRNRDIIYEPKFLLGCAVGAELCGVSENLRTIVGREPAHLNRVGNTERATRGTLTGHLTEDAISHRMKISPETLPKQGERYWLDVGRQIARELKIEGTPLFPNGLVYKQTFELPNGRRAHVFQEFGAPAVDVHGRATRSITNYVLLTPERTGTLPELQNAARKMLQQFREDSRYLSGLGFDDTLPVQKANIVLDGNGVTPGILYEIKPGAYKGKWLGQRPDLLERFSDLPAEQQNRIAETLDHLTGGITD